MTLVMQTDFYKPGSDSGSGESRNSFKPATAGIFGISLVKVPNLG